MVAALGEKPLDQHGVDPFRGEHRLRDALGRVLIVIQSCGSERQIEVGDDRRHFGQRRESPRQVVSDRRGADATLGADDRDHPSQRLRARHAEQLGHRLDEVHDAKRRHQIFADPAGDQLAIENDVVELAEDDHLGPGVAKLGQLLELPEQRVAASLEPRARPRSASARSYRLRPRPARRPCSASHAPWPFCDRSWRS